MTIHEKLSLIQTQFKSKKSRFNKFGNYNFRSAEDILESLKPFNDKHKVYFIIDEEHLGEGVIKSTAYIRDGKDEIKASSIVGVDFNQKGQQMPQRYGSASSLSLIHI